jgi:hypothetical protein
MLELKTWSEDLDLTEFYKNAEHRGFVNNSNQTNMIDCFRNEREWQVWILYYNKVAVGSVAAHSIDEGYRICARTCAFTDLMPFDSLRTRNQIVTHQHVTAQIFMPACIEWAKGPMYITSHPSEVGSQKLVHNIWGPSLEKSGVLVKEFEKDYRGHVQTFWKLNAEEFLRQLDNYPRWQFRD